MSILIPNLSQLSNGINNLWVGRLSSPEEGDVWSRLKTDTPSVAESQPTEKYLNRQQYERLITNGESIVLLDIRDRTAAINQKRSTSRGMRLPCALRTSSQKPRLL